MKGGTDHVKGNLEHTGTQLKHWLYKRRDSGPSHLAGTTTSWFSHLTGLLWLVEHLWSNSGGTHYFRYSQESPLHYLYYFLGTGSHIKILCLSIPAISQLSSHPFKKKVCLCSQLTFTCLSISTRFQLFSKSYTHFHSHLHLNPHPDYGKLLPRVFRLISITFLFLLSYWQRW